MDGWTFDEISETWLYGKESCGCGVYNDGKGWDGNVSCEDIVGIGLFPTKEEAMAECLKKLEELKVKYECGS
jgi:hypothetical protein